MKKLFLLILCFLTFSFSKGQDLMNMKPTGYVNDYENIFSPEQKNELDKLMSDYENKTSIQFFVVTVDSSFDLSQSVDLANKWKIGQAGLNNGLLIMISKAQKRYSIKTGYGLEEFLPDIICKQYASEIFPKYFRQGDFYGGIKEIVIKFQNKLGNNGYDFLVQQKELKKKKSEEQARAFFSGLVQFLVFGAVLGAIITFIVFLYKRRKKYLELKKEIYSKLSEVNKLKEELGKLPTDVQLAYESLIVSTPNKLTKKNINNETYLNVLNSYDSLIGFKKTINSIDTSIETLKSNRKEIEKYLSDKYPYCENYFKGSLNKLLTKTNEVLNVVDQKPQISNLGDGFYSPNDAKKRLGELETIQLSINSGLKSFLDSVNKISTIIQENKNFSKNIEQLKSDYSKYKYRKELLSKVNIGNRLNSLVNIDFENYFGKLSGHISDSLMYLENNDLNSALAKHADYSFTISLIKKSFSDVDSLFDQYNKSKKFIDDNESKINSISSSINSKINHSGVSSMRDSSFSSLNSDVRKYKSSIDTDIILAAGLLGTLVSSLSSLLSSIESDISSYNYSKQQEYYNQQHKSDDSSSSGSSFGGGGGGSFGGGGADGGW